MPTIGDVWAASTWDADAWAANTWADAEEAADFTAQETITPMVIARTTTIQLVSRTTETK